MRSQLIAALALAAASLIPAPTHAQDADVPPSAFAPAPESNQADPQRASPSRGAEFAPQQTGSASGAEQVVPMAPRVAPTATKQPADNASNK